MLFLTALLPLAIHAQQDAEKAAIQQLLQDETDAWNRGDAKAFAAHFAPDGSFTNRVGMQTYGRAPFEAQHQRTLGRVNFIRPDVAIADIDGVLSKVVTTPPGTPLFPDGSLHVKLQLVLSKENGTWQIDSFHNVTVNPAAAGGPPK